MHKLLLWLANAYKISVNLLAKRHSILYLSSIGKSCYDWLMILPITDNKGDWLIILEVSLWTNRIYFTS